MSFHVPLLGRLKFKLMHQVRSTERVLFRSRNRMVLTFEPKSALRRRRAA